MAARVKPHGRFSYFAYYRDLPLATGLVSQMWMNEPDVAYAFPNDDGITVLCVMPSLDRLPEFKADMRGSFERAFAGLPEGPDLARARQIAPIRGKVSMPNVTRRVSAPGLALVGDSAMASDPLWGVGLSFALQAAEMLVDAAAPHLGSERRLDAALRRYRRRHRARLGGHHLMTSDFSTGRAFNPIEKLMFHAAVLDGRSADRFAAFGGRSIGVSRYLSPPALARAGWVVARGSGA